MPQHDFRVVAASTQAKHLWLLPLSLSQLSTLPSLSYHFHPVNSKVYVLPNLAPSIICLNWPFDENYKDLAQCIISLIMNA